MNKTSSLSRYILVILCVAIVFTALILIVLNSIVQNKRLSGLKSGIPAIDQIMVGQTFEDGYKEGYKVARDKCRFSMVTPPGSPIFNMDGTIRSVSADKIQFTAKNIDTDELVDGISNSRTIMMTTSTVISVRTYLTMEEQTKAFEAAAKSTDKNKTMPMPYTEKVIKISDLKAGQEIIVIANEDVRLKEEFAAVQVIVNIMPEVKKP